MDNQVKTLILRGDWNKVILFHLYVDIIRSNIQKKKQEPHKYLT